LSTLIQDLKFGWRQLAKRPGFAAIAVLTLALGIGANTAIFSMINGILLRALPYHEPQQLYVINEVVPQWSPWNPSLPVTGGNFMEWRHDCHAFSGIAALEAFSATLTGYGEPRQLHAMRASANLFSMLGIRPQLGRLFLNEEDQHGRDHEVILTHELWRDTFHSNPAVLGRAIDLNGTSYTVVGILPTSFRFPRVLHQTPQLFKPLGLNGGELEAGLSMHNFTVIARLKAGISPQQALAQLNVIEAQIAKRTTGGRFGLYATLTPLKTVIIGPVEQALWTLLVAAAVILLIICVNLANLMLVRNAGRAHEFAMRATLGGTPQRLARQLLTEAAILAAAGGGLGLLFAGWGLEFLVKNAPVGIPRVDQIQIDARVLWFTLAISIVATLLFALLPALRLARVAPVEALKSAGPTLSAGKSSARLRSGLVIGEIALCGVLLVGALLLVESLMRVVKANSWMEEQRVLAIDLSAPPNKSGWKAQNVAQRAQFFSSILSKVKALPGIQAAGFTSRLPLEGGDWGDGVEFREAPQPETERALGDFRFVSPGYFNAIGMPLVKGRFFTESDHGEQVALISESVAQRVAHGRNPLGMHVHASGSGEGWLRVIGIVGDARTAPDQPAILTVYEPIWLFSEPEETLVVRTAMDPRAATAAIRRAIWSADPEIAIPREETLKTIVQTTIAPRRYETSLGALFALVAVLLAALGLYGVISYSVSQRTHEIGIRVALGAQRRDVLRLVVGQGLRLALIGVAAGLVAAFGLTRFLESMLFGVRPNDAGTFAVVAIVLLAVAFLATYIPARRATKVDPMVALRYE